VGTTTELRMSVRVPEPAETVWSAATDWARQGEWMLGTEVHLLSGDGGLGSRLAAFTGFRGVGVLDTMEVIEWQPPQCCRVRHTGELVIGEGGFHVVRRDPYASTFVWWERLILPSGSSLVWPIVRPAFLWGLRRSLTRFAAFCRRHGVRGDRQ
jgi:hypothetical protein